jgi:hypothetical protein
MTTGATLEWEWGLHLHAGKGGHEGAGEPNEAGVVVVIKEATQQIWQMKRAKRHPPMDGVDGCEDEGVDLDVDAEAAAEDGVNQKRKRMTPVQVSQMMMMTAKNTHPDPKAHHLKCPVSQVVTNRAAVEAVAHA